MTSKIWAEDKQMEAEVFNMQEDSDDDMPQLSGAALAALEEFYQERTSKEQLAKGIITRKEAESSNLLFEENWQLSQFWYSEETISVLAKEASRLAGENGRIALISCPSLYPTVKNHASGSEVLLLEYDRRFAAYGGDFHFYDYNCPLEVPKDWANSCSVVVADPPFLSPECLTKTSLTVRFLAKDKIILCTGAVMGDLAQRLLGVTRCGFEPKHKNNLANEFICLTNYEGFANS